MAARSRSPPRSRSPRQTRLTEYIRLSRLRGLYCGQQACHGQWSYCGPAAERADFHFACLGSIQTCRRDSIEAQRRMLEQYHREHQARRLAAPATDGTPAAPPMPSSWAAAPAATSGLGTSSASAPAAPSRAAPATASAPAAPSRGAAPDTASAPAAPSGGAEKAPVVINLSGAYKPVVNINCGSVVIDTRGARAAGSRFS